MTPSGGAGRPTTKGCAWRRTPLRWGWSSGRLSWLCSRISGSSFWPEAQKPIARPTPASARKRPEGRDRSELRHQPAGKRIGDEPAGVAERELSGEERRAILRMGRNARSKAAGGGEDRRVAQSHQQPCAKEDGPVEPKGGDLSAQTEEASKP